MPPRIPGETAREGPSSRQRHRDAFGELAAQATRVAGSKWAFLTAALSIVAWASFGPYFRYSDHWQIVINTGTTIVTFLMVFLIQNAQNRESKAIHIKLDELIYALNRASNTLIDAETLSEEELNRLGDRYRRLAELHRRKLEGEILSVDREVEGLGKEVHQVEERVATVEKKVEETVAVR